MWYDSFTRHDVTYAEEFANVQGAIVNDESLEKMKKYIYEEYDLELSTEKIASTLELTKKERARNPVEEFIRSATWDGVPRVEELLIRYLGAEDSELNRAMTRKWMVAAVARALTPGIK
ncbi:MAG: VapE domain-containing protein, partial [Bacteroidaceae bacterium]